MNWKDYLPLAGVVLTLFVGLLAALYTQKHDREQLGRTVLLEPAENFARSALTALAMLRHVNPPPLRSGQPHRNELLLSGPGERERRLILCRDAIDAVRADRAHVRLAFHPKSRVAYSSQYVLERLRWCLEAAEYFYWAYDGGNTSTVDCATWRREHDDCREAFKKNRKVTYDGLEVFYGDVAQRLAKPSWDRKFKGSSQTRV